ncbi:MAG: isopeptide-forming domain-containing fimbrial protein [Eubacterium sp.]|nr:isopeptide-forming domain-containing fimbrial protein [Eubacterium sp.]
MKKTALKKVFALLLVLVLAFAMSVPAFAATGGNKYTITIVPGTYTDTSDAAADRYKAYEIFTGNLTPDPAEGELTEAQKNQLSNIAWGADVDVDAFVAALAADEDGAFKGKFDGVDEIADAALQAAAVAKILDENGDDKDFVKAFAILAQDNIKATGAVPVSSTYDKDEKSPTYGRFKIGLDKSGYYLIADEYNGTKTGDIVSEHILEIIRSKEDIVLKSDVPIVNKTNATGNGGYEIGETITFQLVGTLAENFRNFTHAYQYKFVDTMSDGLTYAGGLTAEVWSVNADGSLEAKVDTVTLTKDETPDDDSDDGNYTVAVENSDYDNDETTTETRITIAFDDLKEITNLDPAHVIVIKYNAYINSDAVIGEPEINSVKLVFSNNPYIENKTTETPEKKVAVEAFEFDILKKDSVSNTALAGVQFKLYKEVMVAEEGQEPAPQKLYGVFTDNGDGSYTLNTENNWTVTKADGTELVTYDDAEDLLDGILHIKGLGKGTYYLEEVEAPLGYNELPGAIEIEISATYYTANDPEVLAGTKVEGELKTADATFSIDGEETALVVKNAITKVGIIPIDVLNVPTSALPRTGGIGNYIFYIGGVLLIAAAVTIFLVSKKKASKKAE